MLQNVGTCFFFACALQLTLAFLKSNVDARAQSDREPSSHHGLLTCAVVDNTGRSYRWQLHCTGIIFALDFGLLLETSWTADLLLSSGMHMILTCSQGQSSFGLVA